MTDTINLNEQPLFAVHEITSSRPGTAPAAAPATAAKPAKRRNKPSSTAKPSRNEQLAPSATVIIVPAACLDLHRSLGIDAQAFADAHTELLDELVDDLRRGEGSLHRPQVIKDGDRYLALDNVELVVAARLCSAHKPDVLLTVIVVPAADPALIVREQLASRRGKSGWEQYCAFKPIFEGQPVRQRLRELGLKIALETTVSKVLKVGQLDPELLEAVELYTIPVKEAGQIVDAWKNEELRANMVGVLGAMRQASNKRIDAKQCFKTLLTAGRPKVVEPSWKEGLDGRRDYVASDGTMLATASAVNGRWIAEGFVMSATQWQAFGKGMLRISTDGNFS